MQLLIQVTLAGLLLGGIYALLSVGLNLIFGVLRVINFAHGEFVMLGMYGAYWLWVLGGLDPYVALLVVPPAMFAFGCLVQRFLIQPIMGSSALMKIFVTVGISIALTNLALILWSADYRTVRTGYSTATISLSGISISVPRLVAFCVTVALLASLFIFLRRSRLGKAMRAIAEDRETAQLLGIPVKRLFLVTFGLGTALCGIAGVLLAPIQAVYPTIGPTLTLIAFVVVVLGGLGNMLGTFLGGLLIGVIETWSGTYIASGLQQVVVFGLFVVVLLLRPQGLFGLGRGTEEVGLT